MIKTTLRGLLVIALGGLSTATLAAEPSSGELTLDNRVIEFGAGPNVGVNPTPQAEATCMDPVLPCDHFDLTIDLPENLGEFYPQALVRMVFGWDDPTGSGAEDYDIYMYDADGNEVNSAASASNPETMVQLAYGGTFDFTFDIVYFSVVGSSYNATIELQLGEANPDKTEEEIDAFWMTESVVNRALHPESEVEASPRASQRYAGGALGGMVLLLGLAGLRRRRR